jgi:succinate dehydrogenase / fumarate reductase cytochrome b subunit
MSLMSKRCSASNSGATSAQVGSRWSLRNPPPWHSSALLTRGLVVWLSAAAAGPKPYAAVQGVIGSSLGQIVLFGCSFAFFLHLCGGIRHLVWDTVHGFTLRSIYISGWAVVATSAALTVAAWVASLFVGGWR